MPGPPTEVQRVTSVLLSSWHVLKGLSQGFPRVGRKAPCSQYILMVAKLWAGWVTLAVCSLPSTSASLNSTQAHSGSDIIHKAP